MRNINAHYWASWYGPEYCRLQLNYIKYQIENEVLNDCIAKRSSVQQFYHQISHKAIVSNLKTCRCHHSQSYHELKYIQYDNTCCISKECEAFPQNDHNYFSIILLPWECVNVNTGWILGLRFHKGKVVSASWPMLGGQRSRILSRCWNTSDSNGAGTHGSKVG